MNYRNLEGSEYGLAQLRNLPAVTDEDSQHPEIRDRCLPNASLGRYQFSVIIIIIILTPRCRVLLEKLTGLQLVKKFPAFHGARRFITALTSVRHLSLSWANPFQSTYPHPTPWRFILILSTHLRLCLPSGLFPSGFLTKTLHPPLSSPIHATCPAHLNNNNSINSYLWTRPANNQAANNSNSTSFEHKRTFSSWSSPCKGSRWPRRGVKA